MKNYKIFLKIFLGLTFVFCIACARKPLVHNEAELRERMTMELNKSLQSGNLGLFVRKNNLRGRFVYDFILHKRGQVLSVKLVESTNNNVKQQELLTKYLSGYIFNFKMPRKEKMEIRYTLEI